MVRLDVFSQVTTPHFIAHVFTPEETMELAKTLTTAALAAGAKR